MAATTLISEPLLLIPARESGGQALLATLRYTTSDPLAVSLEITRGPTWVLPREILDPVAAPPPIPGADMTAVWCGDELHLQLRGADGRELALVLDGTGPALAFATEMFALVPPGTEHEHLDWDQLLEGR